MPVAKKKRKVDLGQIWQEFEGGTMKRFVRVEIISRKGAIVSERFSRSGRFSASRSLVLLAAFRRPRFVLWREA